jgi:hypothetical protein
MIPTPDFEGMILIRFKITVSGILENDSRSPRIEVL